MGTPPVVDFRTEPARYRHWRLAVEGRVATLTLDVDEDGGLVPGYALKLNSYDLGVDIELADAAQRLRFEHPGVAAVVVRSANDKVFSAGANIRMLASSAHAWKVNFCKFTNETRNGIEDGAACGQRWLAVLDGTASGGGYELALACDHILLVDDGNTAVSLPEVPLLAVLPGTGGLTRLVDKRGVRRDLADAFATRAEGVRGTMALEWGLVDELTSRSGLEHTVRERVAVMAAQSDRPPGAAGVLLAPLEREIVGDRISYGHTWAALDRSRGVAEMTVRAPDGESATAWALATARELDDLVLHLRTNELAVGTWLVRTVGDPDAMAEVDAALSAQAGDWLVREVLHLWKRTLKRIDVTSRSVIALVEPGSCFTGTLLELALAADRSYMLDGGDPAPAVRLTELNFGAYPMPNGLTRLATRFLAQPGAAAALRAESGVALGTASAHKLGLVTFAPDDIDWDDEVRLAVEERASFSPDALTAMEANLRFPGPETLETKIFGRLSAWQNWVFQRPNAIGALTAYGSGHRAAFDRERV
ncbi:MAG TPA: 2,3-epoxybenzoyl-CoA dihydrolase [Acidimicrobiales bacterium]|nr:2,3-epoxybenzoyl-CoA dihydrolase [Acidimicrobiales bacterium]